MTIFLRILSPQHLSAEPYRKGTRPNSRQGWVLTRTNWWMAPKLVPYAAAPGYNPLSAPIIWVKNTIDPPDFVSWNRFAIAFIRNQGVITFTLMVFLYSSSLILRQSCTSPGHTVKEHLFIWYKVQIQFIQRCVSPPLLPNTANMHYYLFAFFSQVKGRSLLRGEGISSSITGIQSFTIFTPTWALSNRLTC